MSKAGRMRMMSKVVEKVEHPPKLKTNIIAGMATPSPPLGPQLGQRNINIAAFCKDFNERTKNIKEGIPLPCRIKINSDRTYQLVIHNPPATYFLKQAAGIQRGTMRPKWEIAGRITLKHLYEIAKIKAEDPPLALLSLKEICGMMVGIAHTCGIEVVRELDTKEYGEFLKQREVIVAEQKKALQKAKEDKLLRTG